MITTSIDKYNISTENKKYNISTENKKYNISVEVILFIPQQAGIGVMVIESTFIVG